MKTYKKLFGYVPEKKGMLYLSVLFSVVSSILLILPFWYLWKFLEQMLVSRNMNRAVYFAVVIIALMVSYSVTYFMALWASHLLAFRLESNLRKKGTEHLMNASFAFFDVNQSGRIRKIIDDNATLTHMIVAHLIPDITVAILAPLLMLATMFAVDRRLGVLMVVLTLAGLVQMKLMMGGQNFMSTYMKSLERMNAEAVEYIRGMQVVKIFQSSVDSFKAFYEAIREYSRYALNYTLSCQKPYVWFQVIFNVIIAITIPFALIYLGRGESGDGILARMIFFACFSGALFGCFIRIMYVGMYQFQGLQAVEKLERLFEEMEQGSLKRGSVERMEGNDIEFCHVSFGYGKEYVLQNVSFRLEPGKTYALVGSSGGGKSTIAKLISGFYSIQEGEIKIGGIPLTDYTEEALMKNIAFVFQHSRLFKTSIYENVRIGDPGASQEEVMEALRLARCEDILDKLPERERTLIGAGGVHLSGGEVQRIAIARAILKKASIIILDEASAAADPENEYELQQAFANLMKGKTVIMIAHRLSSIRRVDEILVIEAGRVVQRGSHDKLMEEGGTYKAFQEMFARANDWRVYDK